MHDHSHGHAHAHDLRGHSNRKLLALSLVITSTVMVVQVIGALISGSLALLADAAHMFTDAAALVIALIAATVAARPADDRRTFGYQRAEVLGALVNAVILIALAVLVAIEGVSRLFEPAEVVGLPMLVVAVIGMLANAAAMWLLSSAQKRSINVRGAYLEVLGDLIGSAAVIVAAIVILTTGWMGIDAIASLFIAALIVPRAISLLREVFSVLFESAPSGTAVSDIREHLARIDGVIDVHDVHVWQLTRGTPVFSAHLRVDPAYLADGKGGPRIRVRAQRCLQEHFDVEHSTLQLELADAPECGSAHD